MTNTAPLLLSRMQLLKMYAIVARDHHQKKIDPNNPLVLLVRLANLICHKLRIGILPEPDIDILATEEAMASLTSPALAQLEHFLRHNHTITELTACAQGDSPLEPVRRCRYHAGYRGLSAPSLDGGYPMTTSLKILPALLNQNMAHCCPCNSAPTN